MSWPVARVGALRRWRGRAARLTRVIAPLWRGRAQARPLARFYVRVARTRLAVRRSRRTIGEWLFREMEQMETTPTSAQQPPTANETPATSAGAPALAPAGEQQSSQPAPKPLRMILLVRHGQTHYNVEGRLPGQLAGVALTDEGRRQAHRAAVALSALPLSAVIVSPLERARETGEIIARGWALPVREDPRLMDTDVGPWAGRKIDEVAKSDPAWKQFVEHPLGEPPPGVESLSQVQARAVAVVEEALRDESLGHYIVVVAHADVVKLILGHYGGMSVETIRYMSISNASISALAFGDEAKPHTLAVNWVALPGWLAPFSPPKPAEAAPPEAAAPNGRPAEQRQPQQPTPAEVAPAEGTLTPSES